MTSIPESVILNYERQPIFKDVVWTPTLPRHDCNPFLSLVKYSLDCIVSEVLSTEQRLLAEVFLAKLTEASWEMHACVSLQEHLGLAHV